MELTHESMHTMAWTLLLPLILLLNFGFFQYLVLLFHDRWRQPRVLLLLVTAGISVVTVLPFALLSEREVSSMNDLSELSLAIMLLVQTAFVGTNKTKALNSAMPRLVQLLTDLIIALDCMALTFNLVTLLGNGSATSDSSGGQYEARLAIVTDWAESSTLAFTFVYRFGLVTYQKGWRRMLSEDRVELVAHVVFATHQYPFIALDHITGVSWEFIRAIWQRISLVPCVWMTIGEHHYRRPTVLQLRRISSSNLKELLRRASVVAEERRTASWHVSSASVAPTAGVRRDVKKGRAKTEGRSQSCSSPATAARPYIAPRALHRASNASRDTSQIIGRPPVFAWKTANRASESGTIKRMVF